MNFEESKQKLEVLKKCLEVITYDECNIRTVNDILSKIIPTDEYDNNLIGTVVTDGKNTPAAYIPNCNIIRISISGFNNITEETAKVLCERLKYDDLERVKQYYQLFALLHEVEHSKQFLIGKNKYPCDSNELRQGYRNVTSILINSIDRPLFENPIAKAKKTVSFFKYNSAPNDYILERNANVEASNDIIQLAKLNKEDDIREVFELFNLAMKYIGYAKDNLGCMYHTHKKLDLLKEYNLIKKDDIIDEDTRLRYGLEVKHETRDKLLMKVYNSKLAK